MSASHYSNAMPTKFNFFSTLTRKLRSTISSRDTMTKKTKQKSLNRFAQRMLTTRLTKRLSLKRKCRFSRNVWKT
jgi:hypothetical protein